jgi:hypothetical protein
VSGTGYLSLDLTSTVQSWLSGASANNGIALVPSSGSAILASFDSKENILTGHTAQLSLALNATGLLARKGLQAHRVQPGRKGQTAQRARLGQRAHRVQPGNGSRWTSRFDRRNWSCGTRWRCRRRRPCWPHGPRWTAGTCRFRYRFEWHPGVHPERIVYSSSGSYKRSGRTVGILRRWVWFVREPPRSFCPGGRSRWWRRRLHKSRSLRHSRGDLQRCHRERWTGRAKLRD